MFSIVLSLKSLNHAIMRRFEKELKNFDITGGQFMILKYLFDHQKEDVYQKDIEKFISVRGSTATVVLQTLEKKGYLERIVNLNDGRLKKIILCDKAKKMVEDIQNRMIKLEKKIENGLSEEEKKCFSSVVEKIKNNIQNQEE